jgi:predicted ATPase
MVGRDDTVRSLAEQLQMWRFVSIVGPGGAGKTTVAISVAHSLLMDSMMRCSSSIWLR